MATFTFQVGGHRLTELNHAIEELMLRRFPALPPPPPAATAILSSSSTKKMSIPPEPIPSSSSPNTRSDAIDIRSASISGDGLSRKTTASSFSPSNAADIDRYIDRQSPATPPTIAASSFPNEKMDGANYVNMMISHQSRNSGEVHQKQRASAQRKLFSGTSLTMRRQFKPHKLLVFCCIHGFFF